jgi:hypothetical protein
VTAELRRRGVFVRRLTESDLGLFAACRPHISSKQRAININATVAEAMLPRDARRRGETELVTRRYPDDQIEHRLLKKTHKNWRLGGRKIEGDFSISASWAIYGQALAKAALPEIVEQRPEFVVETT